MLGFDLFKAKICHLKSEFYNHSIVFLRELIGFELQIGRKPKSFGESSKSLSNTYMYSKEITTFTYISCIRRTFERNIY